MSLVPGSSSPQYGWFPPATFAAVAYAVGLRGATVSDPDFVKVLPQMAWMILLLGAGFAGLLLVLTTSILAKAVFAFAADTSVKQRILDNARTGGAALWLVAPTRDRADHLVALLADYDYSSLRYYGEEGVADLHRDDG
jgi:hypothetical protein